MRKLRIGKWFALPLWLALSSAAPLPAADGDEMFPAAPPQAQRGPRTGSQRDRVYKDRITPHWFGDNARFWYRNELRGGAKEFLLVDAERGTRGPAFDHAKLAAALSKEAGKEFSAEKLPFDNIEFIEKGAAVRFKVGEALWRCDLPSHEVRAEKEDAVPAEKPPPRADAPRRSTRTGEETYVTFVNRTPAEVELFWLEAEDGRQSYGKIASGAEHRQHTFAGHVWLAADAQGREVARVQAEADTGRFEIVRATPTAEAPPRRPRPRDESERPSERSPDGQWSAFVKDHNVFVKASDDEAKEIPLSEDGREGLAYGRLAWAPDSKVLVAFRIAPGEKKEVHLVQSSPPGGGRAKLQSRPYALPGDRFTQYELNLFDVPARKQVKPDVDKFEHENSTPRLRWQKDGRHFTYPQTDRGHQRFRLMEVDPHTGAIRNLIDERSRTFLWTAHTESANVSPVNWLERTGEIIYASESNGWRHLYLIDAKAGQLKNAITSGEWIDRGLESIDETNRQVWFRASGVYPRQDPYLIHFGRVNFDGSGLTWLTSGDGTHAIAYSPDRKFLIDTFSRVDLAPANELRRVSDGQFICALEESDTADLKADERGTTEVFAAKGRDGTTDIWGIICRPAEFDPGKKYPLIEDIYAGPHGSFVPKTFTAGPRYEALTKLGFIVVKIDGMGTANRSKAFQDVCWRNLKDGGFEDRILWMKAAAKKYPALDITRVGIYGTSAGGQNAAGAVLFHPEFYKAAVANCGCHDNRMDKASWNEQWMGYPVGPHYAECSNIDNAGKLQGRLLLVVGEMDNNVPPESTYRFADALIKANKDFDLLVVPGGGHGAGGAYGQRRLQDFFVRHLQGIEPPSRNAEPRRSGG